MHPQIPANNSGFSWHSGSSHDTGPLPPSLHLLRVCEGCCVWQLHQSRSPLIPVTLISVTSIPVTSLLSFEPADTILASLSTSFFFRTWGKPLGFQIFNKEFLPHWIFEVLLSTAVKNSTNILFCNCQVSPGIFFFFFPLVLFKNQQKRQFWVNGVL